MKSIKLKPLAVKTSDIKFEKFSIHAVTKSPLTSDGVDQLNKEIAWFEYLKGNDDAPVTQSSVINTNQCTTLILKRLNRSLSKSKIDLSVIDKALETTYKFHKPYNTGVASETTLEAIKQNVMSVEDSISDISSIIRSFEDQLPFNDSYGLMVNFCVINGTSTLDYIKESKLIEKTADKILNIMNDNPTWFMNKEASIIHGDLTLDNLMFDFTGGINLVNPKPTPALNGVIGYDYIKMINSLLGLDGFKKSDSDWLEYAYYDNNTIGLKTKNLKNLIVESTNKPEIFDEYGGYSDIMDSIYEFLICGLENEDYNAIDNESRNTVEDLITLWRGLMWIESAKDFGDKPLKALAAYYYGLSLLLIANDLI